MSNDVMFNGYIILKTTGKVMPDENDIKLILL